VTQCSPKKNLCETIKNKGGDYFFVVKDNQPMRRQEIEDYFNATSSKCIETVNKGHGRLEVRRLWALPTPWHIYHWKGCATICKTERIRWKNGTESIEVHYAITSLSPAKVSHKQLLTWWCKHWDIENILHRTKDVEFDEDHCSVRIGTAPEFFSWMRNFSIAVLNISARPLKHFREELAHFPRRSLKLLKEN
jgi:predicted transposase YbfD/YdcC